MKKNSIFNISSIKGKIFFYTFILTIFLLVSIISTTYTTYFKTLRDNKIESTIAASYKTRQNIEFILKQVDNVGQLLGANKDLLDALKQGRGEGIAKYRENQNKIYLLLKDIVSVQQHIKSIYVISSDYSLFTNDSGVKEEELIKNYSSFESMSSSPGKFYIGAHQVDYSDSSSFVKPYVISYAEPIFDVPTQKKLATIIIDLNYDSLKESLTISSIQNDEKVIVINNQGQNIFTYPYNIILDDVIKNNPELLTKNQVRLSGKVFGEDSIIISNAIQYSDWKIINIISTKKLYQDITRIVSSTTLLCALFIILVMLASYILSTTITKPIVELNKKIKQVEEGNLSVNIPVKRNDELGELSRSFNSMLIKIKSLINKLVEEQKQKSAMEFEILQAQINPHFLYNTLDSIKWLAIIHNANNISDMTSSLINLLKYNISGKDSTVTLSEEIESIKHYIKIQKYRYGNIFDVEYNIEEAVLKCKVLRLILQPIVENAIFHGFESFEGNGKIIIGAYLKDSYLTMYIIDNGTGMTRENLSNILNRKASKNSFSGIGLKNIEDRIKLYFGEKFGLAIESSAGKGTKVVIILPAIY